MCSYQGRVRRSASTRRKISSITARPPTLPFWTFFFSRACGANRIIQNDAREFLARLLETESTPVQSDILDRVQETRARLEEEIRKLSHEVSQIAEPALVCARKVKEDGEPAVQTEIASSGPLATRSDCPPRSCTAPCRTTVLAKQSIAIVGEFRASPNRYLVSASPGLAGKAVPA